MRRLCLNELPWTAFLLLILCKRAICDCETENGGRCYEMFVGSVGTVAGTQCSATDYTPMKVYKCNSIQECIDGHSAGNFTSCFLLVGSIVFQNPTDRPCNVSDVCVSSECKKEDCVDDYVCGVNTVNTAQYSTSNETQNEFQVCNYNVKTSGMTAPSTTQFPSGEFENPTELPTTDSEALAGTMTTKAETKKYSQTMNYPNNVDSSTNGEPNSEDREKSGFPTISLVCAVLLLITLLILVIVYIRLRIIIRENKKNQNTAPIPELEGSSAMGSSYSSSLRSVNDKNQPSDNAEQQIKISSDNDHDEIFDKFERKAKRGRENEPSEGRGLEVDEGQSPKMTTIATENLENSEKRRPLNKGIVKYATHNDDTLSTKVTTGIFSNKSRKRNKRASTKVKGRGENQTSLRKRPSPNAANNLPSS